MKLIALNAKTGKVLLKQDGNLDESNFKTIVQRTFPFIEEKDITIICDGDVKRGQTVISTSRKSKKNVVWKGSFTDLGGYANMNREICFRLLNHGFSVKVDMLRTRTEVDGVTNATLRAMESTRLEGETMCPLVVGFTPMSIRRTGRKVIFYTMMETQSLHNVFVQSCNDFADEIWVPCEFYKEVFKKSGVVKPISVIPLGVNQLIYKTDIDKHHVLMEDILNQKKVHAVGKNYKFMSLFGWSYRKGPDVLCKSFIREFSGKDDAALVIFSRYMGSSQEHHKDHVRKEILEYYKEEGKEDPPPIYYCGDEIPIADLPGCYASNDAFVFCSRGEGFGLPVIEAGACGLPIISSYNTAMTQYLDDEVSYLQKPKQYGAANEKLTWISEFYRNQDFVIYTEEDIIEFGRLMRRSYENRAESADKAALFRKRILEEYTWDKCAARVAEKLNGFK